MRQRVYLTLNYLFNINRYRRQLQVVWSVHCFMNLDE